MTDDEFLAAFENCTLPYDQWTHHAHVRLAYLYATAHRPDKATSKIRTGIQAYNKATDTPESIDRGYHETITQAFMRLVSDACRRTGPHRSSDDFVAENPQLLSKYVLQTYYSRQRLFSAVAKREFVSPDIQPLPRLSMANRHAEPSSGDEFLLIESFTDERIDEIHSLVRHQWWGGKRELEDVRLMAQHTSLMIGLVDIRSDRLVGFSRVLTDFAFRATIYDVMVASEYQGRGLGKRLMDAICDHPKLQKVSFLYLCCEPALYAFYERCGFRGYEGRAEWMIKVQREE